MEDQARKYARIFVLQNSEVCLDVLMINIKILRTVATINKPC